MSIIVNSAGFKQFPVTKKKVFIIKKPTNYLPIKVITKTPKITKKEKSLEAKFYKFNR